jgi:hypothetical protein
MQRSFLFQASAPTYGVFWAAEQRTCFSPLGLGRIFPRGESPNQSNSVSLATWKVVGAYPSPCILHIFCFEGKLSVLGPRVTGEKLSRRPFSQIQCYVRVLVVRNLAGLRFMGKDRRIDDLIS